MSETIRAVCTNDAFNPESISARLLAAKRWDRCPIQKVTYDPHCNEFKISVGYFDVGTVIAMIAEIGHLSVITE